MTISLFQDSGVAGRMILCRIRSFIRLNTGWVRCSMMSYSGACAARVTGWRRDWTSPCAWRTPRAKLASRRSTITGSSRIPSERRPTSFSQLRIDRAKRLLACDHLPVTEVCFAVGYESLGSFSSRFRSLVGYSPSEYQRAFGRLFPAPNSRSTSCPDLLSC